MTDITHNDSFYPYDKKELRFPTANQLLKAPFPVRKVNPTGWTNGHVLDTSIPVKLAEKIYSMAEDKPFSVHPALSTILTYPKDPIVMIPRLFLDTYVGPKRVAQSVILVDQDNVIMVQLNRHYFSYFRKRYPRSAIFAEYFRKLDPIKFAQCGTVLGVVAQEQSAYDIKTIQPYL